MSQEVVWWGIFFLNRGDSDGCPTFFYPLNLSLSPLYEPDKRSFMYLQQLVNCSRVVATLYHARMLWDATPESMFRHAIPIAVAISLKYGRLRLEDRRVVGLHVPNSLVPVVVVLTGASYSNELVKDFYGHSSAGGLATYLYERLGFWVFLSLNATDVAQVLLPMYMMVRPVHGLLVFIVLGVQRRNWH